jgi:UDP-N-acetylmuramate: L-alanyl-gamma-D-glutamyl-meso-diaminopimelate ligase
MKLQFPDRHLVACMELHTFSSLSKAFLQEYRDAMQDADTAIVFYSPDVLAQKKLEPISAEDVREGFHRDDLIVLTSKDEFSNTLHSMNWTGKNLLLMSSGDFGGLVLTELAASVAGSLQR